MLLEIENKSNNVTRSDSELLLSYYLFLRIFGLLMSEIESMMMRANSFVLSWLRNSKENEGDDILIGEHGDDGDETVPNEFDESEAKDHKGCWWTEP